MTWENRTKLFAALISTVAVIAGGWQYIQTQRIAAAAPYLEKKLAWCEEAVETAAALAVRVDRKPEDVVRFWELYWGVMVLIEGGGVEQAMVEVGRELERAQSAAGGEKGGDASFIGLRGASLSLAKACRDELADEWSPRWLRRGGAAPGGDAQNAALPSGPSQAWTK